MLVRYCRGTAHEGRCCVPLGILHAEFLPCSPVLFCSSPIIVLTLIPSHGHRCGTRGLAVNAPRSRLSRVAMPCTVSRSLTSFAVFCHATAVGLIDVRDLFFFAPHLSIERSNF